MNFSFQNIIKAFLLSSTIICWSIILSLNFTPLYDYSINKYKILENSNLSLKKINENYNYVIKYTTSFNNDEFKLPSLPYSKEAAIHFKEVKNIFKTIYFMLFLSYFIFIAYFLTDRIKFHNTNMYFLVISYKFLLYFCILISYIYKNFDTSFNTFHKIFFNNDYWLFDPTTDPIINILPEGFFYMSSVFIIILILINALILYVIYYKSTIP